jgi:small subunit ribosomal protein S17
VSETTTKKKSASSKAKSTVVSNSVERGTRKIKQGYVSSSKMSKTVVVKIEMRSQHPLYKKIVISTGKFKAHDEIGCDVGDLVEIMETRPISKEKRWRVTRIVEKVK